MMAGRARAKSAGSAGPGRAAADSPDPPPPVRPLKPRPGLLVITSGVFTVWLLFLVYLYFTTVYHHRGVAPGIRVPTSDQSSS